MIHGDGIDTISHYGETALAKKKLVLADITYTNTSEKTNTIKVLETEIDYENRFGQNRRIYVYLDAGFMAHQSLPAYVSDSSKTGEDSPYIREI